MRASARSEAGVTLVELMVAMLVFSIVVAAALTMGTAVVQSYTNHRQAVEVQRNARVSLELMSDWMRNSSPGVPSGKIGDLVSGDCSHNVAFEVVNSTTGSDELYVTHAVGGVVTSLRADYGDASTVLTVLNGAEFAVGDMAVVTNLDVGHIVKITDVAANGAEWDLTTDAPTAACVAPNLPAGGYHSGDLVIRARLAHFYVDPDFGPNGEPTLMVDFDSSDTAPEPLAAGVEDFQIAVGIDEDGDGELTEDGSGTDEWFHNSASDITPPPFGALVPRAVRISVVARTREEEAGTKNYFLDAIEDRASSATADGFRRRTLSTTVEIRNLTGSPL